MVRERPNELIRHAAYLTWATTTVNRANAEWTRRSGSAIPLLSTAALHSHLFRWGIAVGRLPELRKLTPLPWSFYVAQMFHDDRLGVEAEARNYWRVAVKDRKAHEVFAS